MHEIATNLRKFRWICKVLHRYDLVRGKIFLNIRAKYKIAITFAISTAKWNLCDLSV
jgi:hypothetical protein